MQLEDINVTTVMLPVRVTVTCPTNVFRPKRFESGRREDQGRPANYYQCHHVDTTITVDPVTKKSQFTHKRCPADSVYGFLCVNHDEVVHKTTPNDIKAKTAKYQRSVGGEEGEAMLREAAIIKAAYFDGRVERIELTCRNEFMRVIK